jgi:hypothetical protein
VGDSRASDDWRVPDDVLMPLDAAFLILAAFLKPANPLFDILNDLNDRNHSELTVPQTFDLCGPRSLKMNLALHDVKLEVGPMFKSAPHEFACHATQLLERDPMLFHEHCNCAQTNYVLERVDAAVRNEAVLVRVARLKKASVVRPPKLPLGQPGESLNVLIAKGANYGHICSPTMATMTA